MMTNDTMKYLFFICLPVWAFIAMKPVYAADPSCQLIQNIPEFSSQVIIVRAENGIKAVITACQREGASWKAAFKPFKAVIGKKGLAALGKKREGDMKTPTGLYPLGDAFGTEPFALKMDYKYITPEDKFIDDASNPRYNTWVRGSTDAKSYETMLYGPYKMGLVVNYNMNPTISGAGSAIFIHLWKSADIGTYGCIAMDEAHLLALLKWLDKNQHPYIDINRTAL